jgi:hypothetical protein
MDVHGLLVTHTGVVLTVRLTLSVLVLRNVKFNHVCKFLKLFIVKLFIALPLVSSASKKPLISYCPAKLLHLFLALQVIASSCKFLQDISLDI